MPQQVDDIKSFIEICLRKDAKSARIKKSNNGPTKFKVRCRRYLYTLSVNDSAKADKLRQSLPPGLTITETPKKNAKGKRVAKA
ncbi:ribosomal protein L38e [Piedraia hortae CBS 480.64]|uniref:Ribosomal protein L38e n=1 Tax=Piedraia hortae CBS 480.64 TaxID=1314780 RepID=A0A6A7C8F2_9PEZI|nr:ribosomal protein L38e [Piedraia hortae CBS 480.64]